MSEQVEEQEQAPEEEQPEEDIPFEEPEPEEEPAEATTEAAPALAVRAAASEQEEETYRKLDTKADNYFKGLRGLLENSQIPLQLCELCANAYPGVRWTEPQDDPTRAMLGIIGATASGSPLLDDPDAQVCDRCGGFGWTKLPAHVPGNTERKCKRCNGAGWLDTSQASGALVAPEPAAENGSPEPLAGIPETDPAVVELRARGFTIIPPMQIAGAEQQGG